MLLIEYILVLSITFLLIFLLTCIILIINNIYKIIEFKKTIIEYNKKNNTKLIIICDNDITDYKIYQIYNKILDYYCRYDIININNYQLITQIINNNNNVTIIIESLGGDISSNDNIINIMMNNKINTYILTEAKSAATMIVLGSSNIYMDKHATLGPTDPQISINNITYSVKSLINLCENKTKDNITDEYLINYYENKKLYYENIENVKKMLSKHFIKNISNNKKEEIINKFTDGEISHHIPINYNYLKKYININTNISLNIRNIYTNYKKIF